jgi:hypothetical protein
MPEFSVINTKPESHISFGAFQNHLLVSSCPSNHKYQPTHYVTHGTEI